MKIIGFGAVALALTGFAGPLYAAEDTEKAAVDTQQAAAVVEPAPVPADQEMKAAPLRAPRRAFELGLDMGYTQGFGTLDTRKLNDVVNAGGAVGLSLGYRATPGFSIAATGQFQGFMADNSLPRGTMVRGAAAGLAATFHIAPYERANPFVTLGSGYRMLWEVPSGNEPTVMTHGFQLGKLEVGVDLRLNDSIAIAPVIGADVDMFMWRNTPGAAMADLSNRGVSTFLFAGLRGRFDIGGERDVKLEPVQ